MSLAQRVGVLAGALAATLITLIIFQSVTHKAETQTEDQDAAAEQPSFPTPNDREFAEGQIIVKLEEEATQADLTALNRRNDARTEEDLPGSDLSVVALPRDLPVQEAVQRYEASPDVEYAEPDFLLFPSEVTPNDPGYDKLYGLNNTGQTGGTSDGDIDAPDAWDNTIGSSTTVVAVIDTGVDISHPDLKNNVWTNPGEIANNGIDDDRNGYKDDVNGWDFYHDDKTVYDSGDGDGHGTHVAGTIAAEGDNGTGVTGVNWVAQIMPLKFLGPDGGYTSDAVKAINYALAEGVKISNNSWSGGGYSKTLADTIKKADNSAHLFVAAAGNDGKDNDATPSYPSSYDSSNIIAVAATDGDDTLASFSNYGSTSVDLGAPGVSILSTLPENSYGWYSGTSMATPHVTGVATLIKSQHPLLSDGEVKARILKFAEPKNSLQGETVTGGRLNAVASVTRQAASDETKPTISSMRPRPGSSTRDRTPTIRATVSDDRTEFAKSYIRLYLDGKQRTKFSYNRNTDRLSYTTPKLSYSRHTVKIVAEDAAGNTVAKSWKFKVIR